MLGDYRLDAVIGHGGFGITYRAFDSQLAKVVAIKEYLPVEFAVRRGPEGRARAARASPTISPGAASASSTRRGRSPASAIRTSCRCMRFLAANGTAYTVMEFEDGRSLAEMLREPGRRLPPDEVRRLAEGLAARPGRGACAGLPASRHQAVEHHHPARRRADPDRLRRGAAGDGQPHAHHDLGADAAIRADRAIRRSTASRGRGATSIPPPRCCITPSPARRRPKRRAGSARIPTGRSSRRRPTVSTRRSSRRSIAALAFAPEQRPQSIDEWSKLFGLSLPRAHDAPTQRMEPPAAPADPTPRLGGVSRETARTARAAEGGVAAPQRDAAGSCSRWPWSVGRRPCGITRHALLDRVASLLPQGTQAANDAPAEASAAPSMPAPTPMPAALRHARADAVGAGRLAGAEAAGRPGAARRRRARARSSRRPRRPRTQRAPWRAKRASRRLARRDRACENAERITADDGASYVGQVADGKRQGLGVLEFKDGERQAGEWKNDDPATVSARAAERRPALRRPMERRPAGRPRRAREAGQRARRGQFRRRPARRARHAARAVRADHDADRRIRGRHARMAWASRRLANGERYEGTSAPASGNGYGQLIGRRRTGARRPLGRRKAGRIRAP